MSFSEGEDALLDLNLFTVNFLFSFMVMPYIQMICKVLIRSLCQLRGTVHDANTRELNETPDSCMSWDQFVQNNCGKELTVKGKLKRPLAYGKKECPPFLSLVYEMWRTIL